MLKQGNGRLCFGHFFLLFGFDLWVCVFIVEIISPSVAILFSSFTILNLSKTYVYFLIYNALYT